MRFWKRNSHFEDFSLTPDEIFLDSENIPGFSRERFEGIIERPISSGAIYSFAALLFLFGGLLFGRTLWLQVVRGNELESRAVNNYIQKTYIEPPRGLIYDRKGRALVTNEVSVDEKQETTYWRSVRHPFAYSHILGFVSALTAEDIKKSSQSIGISEKGKTGLEERYDDRLRGVPGERNEELNASGKILSRGVIKPSQAGENITTTLNADLQEELWSNIDRVVLERGFHGGAGIIFSVSDGSILAIVSDPSFDLNLFSKGLDAASAKELFSNSRAPLFNRAVAGTYAPGSIIKPFIALAALDEHIISPNRQIYSSGSISIPDPFQKGKESIFLDWKAHGFVDMRRAIAVSSDVYFYTIGGGFGDMSGLGILKIKSWLSRFGFDTSTGINLPGEKSGFLPDPESKKKSHPENPIWRIGDTYHASIGQGDTLVTVVEVMRGLGILANSGKKFTPYLVKGEAQPLTDGVSLNPEYYQIIKEGMRQSADIGGTAAAVAWVPEGYAAKTGTAEIGNKDRVNSWFIGYTPYEKPKIGVVILMESGPRANLVGASSVASDITRWIIDHGGIDALLN
ncbi:MAG: penicillin-binding transpeptidase domain-containing protein [Patescibacteria group bacterium]|mgnify:CR=1 FL=1